MPIQKEDGGETSRKGAHIRCSISFARRGACCSAAATGMTPKRRGAGAPNRSELILIAATDISGLDGIGILQETEWFSVLIRNSLQLISYSVLLVEEPCNVMHGSSWMGDELVSMQCKSQSNGSYSYRQSELNLHPHVSHCPQHTLKFSAHRKEFSIWASGL
jgi:hypothetical protein